MYAPHLLLTSSPIYTESVSFLHNDPWISMRSSASTFSLLTVLQLYILSLSVHNICFYQYIHVLEQHTVLMWYSVFPISSPHIHSTVLLLPNIFSHIGTSIGGKTSILTSVIKCQKLPNIKQKIRRTIYFPV